MVSPDQLSTRSVQLKERYDAAQLRIGVQSKGHLRPVADKIFSSYGIAVPSPDTTRTLIGVSDDGTVCSVGSRNSELCKRVANCDVDVAVIGMNELLRYRLASGDLQQVQVSERFDYAFSWSLVLAIPAYQTNCDRIRKIVTSYVPITRAYLSQKGLSIPIESSDGSTEVTPYFSSDVAVVELASTGQTLANNGLRVIDQVGRDYPVLIYKPQNSERIIDSPYSSLLRRRLR